MGSCGNISSLGPFLLTFPIMSIVEKIDDGHTTPFPHQDGVEYKTITLIYSNI